MRVKSRLGILLSSSLDDVDNNCDGDYDHDSSHFGDDNNDDAGD